MSSKPSRFTRFVVIALVVLMLPFFVLGTAIAATGTVTVKVADTGPDMPNLYIPVPALLFDAALFLAPRMIPDEALADARREIEPYREHIELLADELAGMPSGVLVEVESGDEQVRITKSWRSYHITGDSPDADIQVSVPARLLSRALDIL